MRCGVRRISARADKPGRTRGRRVKRRQVLINGVLANWLLLPIFREGDFTGLGLTPTSTPCYFNFRKQRLGTQGVLSRRREIRKRCPLRFGWTTPSGRFLYRISSAVPTWNFTKAKVAPARLAANWRALARQLQGLCLRLRRHRSGSGSRSTSRSYLPLQVSYFEDRMTGPYPPRTYHKEQRCNGHSGENAQALRGGLSIAPASRIDPSCLDRQPRPRCPHRFLCFASEFGPVP